MPFSKEYLKDYEKKIRALPLENLYDILCLIRDDPFKADETPERIQIVEKRIRELNPDDVFDEKKEPFGAVASEKLNDKLEEEFKKKPHTKTAIIETVGLISALLGFLFFFAKNENGLSFGMPFIAISLLCLVCTSLIDKRVHVRAGVMHKDAYPICYWCTVITELIAAIVIIAMAIDKGF